MAIPATALRRRDRMWPAVLASVAVHAGAIAWAVAEGGPVIDLEQKPIVARLVRLGEKRPKEYLPRKEEPPPEPAPPAAAPAPEVATAAAVPTKPGPGPKAPAAPASRTAGSGKNALANVLTRMRKQVDDEDRWGDPEGDPMGDASDGSEGDRYLALATRALQEHYVLPTTISEKERLYLKATVVLYVEPDGRISRFRFETTSGNAAFDDALERAIRQTRLPPPPPESRELYRKTGLAVGFRI